jgi:hypothetical protein
VKKILVITILTVLTLIPASLRAGWARTYGTAGTEAAFCVQATADGGYIVSGHSEPLEGGWVIKTDEQGDTLWTKTFFDEFMLGGLCIQTSDSGYILTIGGRLVKLDENGDSVWGNTPPLRWSSIEWVEETTDGNYIATGYVEEHYPEGDDRSKLTIAKIDSLGNRVFNYGYGGMKGDLDGGSYIQETADSGFIISGWRNNGASLWLVKFDFEGSPLWYSYHDTLERGICVRQTSDGGYVVSCGEKLVKTNAAGELEWTRAWGEGADVGFSLALTSDDGYVVTGAKYPSGSSSWERSDLWLLKADAGGNTLWTRIYGGSRHDAGYCVQVTPDGGYIVAGSTTSYGAGDRDFWLIKTDSLGLLEVKEPVTHPVTRRDWEIVTPVGRTITLRALEDTEPLDLAVFDASGRMVDEIQLSTGTVTWPVTHQTPGVYFIRERTGRAPAQKAILTR